MAVAVKDCKAACQGAALIYFGGVFRKHHHGFYKNSMMVAAVRMRFAEVALGLKKLRHRAPTNKKIAAKLSRESP